MLDYELSNFKVAIWTGIMQRHQTPAKIDKMERDHELLLAELARQKEQNMVKEKTIRDVNVLERRIKLQRKHTIKIIKKSMQEPDSEVKLAKHQIWNWF